MDELEITCIVKDANDILSHCGVKGYGVQNVLIIEKLISEEACNFFIYEGENKRNVYARTSPKGTIFLTIYPNWLDMNTLNSLPLLDRPLLRHLIESVRWFRFYICSGWVEYITEYSYLWYYLLRVRYHLHYMRLVIHKGILYNQRFLTNSEYAKGIFPYNT